MSEHPDDLAEAKQQVDVRHGEGGPFVQAVDATSMAMIVTDCHLPDNPIVFANASFLAMTGYSPEEVIGRNYRLLYGERTDPGVEEKVSKALNAKGDIVMELVLHRKDGQGLWVMQHVSIQYENGAVRRHFASFWDIDRRVQAERELRRSHALLEQRIAARTRELSRSVENLRRENEKRRAAEEVLLHMLNDKDELLAQRDFLMREINHRAKNTLQLVSALLTVQAGATTDKPVLDGLNAAVGRLDRLAEVHQLLYESERLGMVVDLATYLQFLCDRLMLSGEASSGRISLMVDVEEGNWSADQAIPIALIVNETVTNALKHAFPNDRQGTVTVSLHNVGQNFYELVIADDGVGAQSMGRSGSLGMKLVDSFARQLGGGLQVSDGGGTRVCVRFLHEDIEPLRLAE